MNAAKNATATPAAPTANTYSAEALAAKLVEARKVIAPCVPADKDGARPTDPIGKVLAEIGVYEDAESHSLLMGQCQLDDLVDRLMDSDERIPLLRARQAASILLGGRVDQPIQRTPAGPVVVARLAPEDKPVGQWSDRQLVEALGTEDHGDEAAEVLDKKAQGRVFVVYEDEEAGRVNIEVTMKMLALAKKGRSPINWKVGNCLKRLYRSIESPNVVFVECPFHPGTLLVDGYCDQCCQNWDGSPDEVLQFARLVSEAGEAPEKAPDVRRFFKDAVEGGIDILRELYEAVAMTFDQLKGEGNLPNLRRRQSSGRAISDPMNPNRRF